jgi:hypothetical protein
MSWYNAFTLTYNKKSETRVVEVMPLSAPVLAKVMTGAYDRSRVADKRTYDRTYDWRFFFPDHKPTFPLLYRASARRSDVSSSSWHCWVEVMPLYTEKKRSITADDG